MLEQNTVQVARRFPKVWSASPVYVDRVLRCSSCEFCHGVGAPAQQSKGSVILYSVLLCTEKMETRVQRIPSLNTGTWRLFDEQNRGSAENVQNAAR
jgi:hypothetical protein